MLTSLFGDLSPLFGSDPDKPSRSPRRHGHTGDFAATAILESTATEVNDHGQMVDKHTRDLFITGSPAEAIRKHLASSRADLDRASRQITLFDPARMWAASVVKALSDASGQPIERLHLRDQNTLASIAQIERTALPRRVEDPLKVYYADVRDTAPEARTLPIALMERSHLVAVIVAPMDPQALDEIVALINRASHRPDWMCPNLLVMLSTPMAPLAARIASVRWPERLNVIVTTEPMTSASAVWNTVLNTWNKVKSAPGWQAPEARPSVLGGDDFPIRVQDLEPKGAAAVAPVIAAGRLAQPTPAATTATAQASATTPVPVAVATAAQATQAGTRPLPVAGMITDPARTSLDEARIQRTLTQLMQIEGLIGCCIADTSTGMVLGQEREADADDLNLDLAAATATEVLKAHRRASRDMGCGDRIDEVIVTHGRRHQVIRTVAAHAELFVLAVLDKQRTNLALARFKIMDAEKSLG